jgi:hypothetical protein
MTRPRATNLTDSIFKQPDNVIASAAKQSILSYFLGALALWIASLRSQCVETWLRDLAGACAPSFA